MLNENAKKWVAALRSGEYQQCKDQLTDGRGYCCLGVGAAISPGPRSKWENEVALPKPVQQWLGLRSSEGDYESGADYRRLSNLNDYGGKTFAQIADLIESEPEGLFA